MTESIETSINTEEDEIIETIRGELGALVLDIKRDSFGANQELKNRIKTLGFYDGNENGENIKFHIGNVKKYLESIKNKTWSDLEVKASGLEKGVRTIAIQIAINYINMKNGGATDNIDWIDGVRGNQTWKGVKEFQSTYKLKNIDGLPGRETITKILEILGNYTGSDNENDGIEADTSETENFDETEEFLQNGLNQNSVDNSKCINLIKNLKINDNGKLHDMQDLDWIDFENKLKDKFVDESSLESIIFQNHEIQKLLCNIISNQGKEIDNMKRRYLNRKNTEYNNNAPQKAYNELNNDKKQIDQSWEDYKFENSSIDNFENFILSEKGISVIINEIKSHIDTSHENLNGEYDRFYDKYPLSAVNLEVKLKYAWESSMKSDYNKDNYDEKMEKLDVISNQITLYVDEIIGKSLKGGKEYFSQDIIPELEGLFLKGTEGGNIIELLSNQDYRDSFMEVLGSKIKNYETFVRNKDNDFILNTGDKQIDLQLKSYLYIYGRIFYSDYFNPSKNTEYYDEILPDVMRSIISHDDKSLINKINNKKFLEIQQKLQEERKKRDLQRRQEIAKRNKERNERLQSSDKINKQSNNVEIKTNSSDRNDATGPEIAAGANLDLTNYSLNIEKSEYKEEWGKETIFRNAYNKFINSHGDIKAYITQEQMFRIFDIDTNNINKEKREEFKEFNPIFKDKPDSEIENIHHIFNEFSWCYNEAKEELSKDSAVMKQKVDETVKTYAIGSVIDNVRNTFEIVTEGKEGNFKGLKLIGKNPVIQDGNDIIISGSFDGSGVKVRYNLETGELYMNSFLHRLSPNKINLGINSTIDYPIGAIKPFNNVLNDYYKLPPRSPKNNETHNGFPYGDRDRPRLDSHTHSRPNRDDGEPKNDSLGGKAPKPASVGPNLFNVAGINTNPKQYEIENLLNSQMDLIGDAMEKHMKSQAQKSASINNFMKTFNIISDSGQFSSWDFNRGSNLYDIIEIIENTGDIKNGNIQSLEYFNNVFMPTIAKYSGLIWGEWHEYQEINEDYEKLAKYDGDNNDIKALQYYSNNYDSRPFSGANFDSSHQLGFAEFITGKDRQNNGKKDENKINFVSRSEPDWILDKTKMENFIKDLYALNKDKKSDESNDSNEQPSEQLPNT